MMEKKVLIAGDMKNKIKLAFITLFCVILGGTLFLIFFYPNNKPSLPIPVLGGANLSIKLPAPRHYLQTDSRWASDTIGGSGETIGGVGCTLCSVATALTALGHSLTPAELNQHLVENTGYTSQGWIIWSAIPHAKVNVISQPSHDVLDAAIQSGHYPVVKFWLPQGIPHWVVLVGKNNLDYIALDPLSLKPAMLSSLTSKIYSIRIIQDN